MKRYLVRAALLYLLVSAIAGSWIIERALTRSRVPITMRDAESARDLASDLGATLTDVSLNAADGARLAGWLFTPSSHWTESVLLLHAITTNRADMLSAARMFLSKGYRTLAVDLRAQGDSDGALLTYGALETDDTARWIAFLRSADRCTYVFGRSLGAAYALQAASTSGLCGVVAQSGFISYRDIAIDRVAQQFHTGPWIGQVFARTGIEAGLLYVRLRHGINLAHASALETLAGPGPPVLVIHGSADDNVPVRHAELAKSANPVRVQLWIVPAGHSIRLPDKEYWQPILSFFEAHRQPFTGDR